MPLLHACNPQLGMTALTSPLVPIPYTVANERLLTTVTVPAGGAVEAAAAGDVLDD